MTDTDKNPARSFHYSPRDFFISDSGNVAGILLHADPETDADRVVRADVDPLHQPRDDHPPGFRLRVIEGFRSEKRFPQKIPPQVGVIHCLFSLKIIV